MILSKQNVQEVEFDMEEQRALVIQEVKQSLTPVEVEKYLKSVDLTNPMSLLSYGEEAASEIAKNSDAVLRNTQLQNFDKVSAMVNSLDKIMSKFDMKELEEPKNPISKLFFNAKNSLTKVLEKYNTMGAEVDKVYVELKKYEAEIEKDNQNLEKDFSTNLEYYTLLQKYIYAGEEGLKLIDAERKRLEEEYAETQDSSIRFQIQTIELGKEAFSKRLMTLRTAENMAMQSIPMMKIEQYSNMNLVEKINSSFIITLPLFKQALSRKVALRNQKLYADALQALDDRTNELLKLNATATVEQAKQIAKMTSETSIKIETLENTWKTIVTGIEEVKSIRLNAEKKREEDKVRLERIKNEYNQKLLLKGN